MSDAEIDGTDYSKPRHNVAVKGDEAQTPEYVDRTAVVEEMKQYFINQGMEVWRVDRYGWPGERGQDAFYVEIGTVLGEVRIRIHVGGERIETVDIRSSKHIQSAKRRIGAIIRRSKGERWVRGEGWVKA